VGEQSGQYPRRLVLPNGNVLFADGNIHEVIARDHKVVFEYIPENQKGGGAYSCQRLPNGNTVVGENASGRVVEVDATGRVVFALQTRYGSTDDHHICAWCANSPTATIGQPLAEQHRARVPYRTAARHGNNPPRDWPSRRSVCPAGTP
jgi:prepilin-type processing-associated H-X9-DG protein